MPVEIENDEVVMTLVAATLQRTPEEREGYLREACGNSPALFDTIWQRVRWEERMGSFLMDPMVSLRGLDPSFQPGDILADRFRVIRKVAHGGMGVVYEALDQKLERRVAIKCALPGYGGRLPPEARNAREVSHRNVCKLHDIHTCRTPFGEMDFLSMEYLEGETLEQRVQRDRRMAESEVSEIARQLLAGLESAHSKGVVHGDLKSNNVVLTKEPSGQLRVVITDFGLARPVAASEPTGASALASAGIRGGAPEYMAPELLRGDPPSIAADVYAFGVILHELVVGSRPTMPGQVAHGVPKHWKRVIARCLQPEPGKRFTSAQQILKSPTLQPRRRRAWATLVAPLFLLLIPEVRNAINDWWAGPPVRLAVLPFEAEPDITPLAWGLLHDVSDRLASSGKKLLDKKLLVIPFADTQKDNVRTLEMARSHFNATHVLRGKMAKNGDRLVVSGALVEVESHVEKFFSNEYRTGELSLVPKAITGSVAAALHLHEPRRAETVSSEAYPFYVQGLYFLRRDIESGDSAIDFFERAKDLDPSSALPYAGLAEAQLQNHRRKKGGNWLNLAHESVSKAEARNPDSVPVRLVSGLLQETEGAYDRAAEDYSRAIELDPRSADAWRRLANIYVSMNRPGDALKTYRKAIQVDPGYHRPYLDLAGFYFKQAQFDEAEKQYRKALEVASATPAGHSGLGAALMQMERYEEAEKEFLAALQVREAPNYLTNLGLLAVYKGQEARAVDFYARAIKQGPTSNISYLHFADSLRRLNRGAEAESAYRKAREMGEDDILDDPRDAMARATVAYACARLDEAKCAEKEIAQAVKFRPQDASLRSLAARTYEVLNKREKSLEILESLPLHFLRQLSRHPDLAGLREDPRFVELLKKKSS